MDIMFYIFGGGVTGCLCVLFCTIINRLASRCRCRGPFFLRAVGATVSDGIGFLLPSYWNFAGHSLLRWLLSSFLDTLFFAVPDGLGSPCALCTPPAGRLREFMLDYSFPGSSGIRRQSLKRLHYINSLHLPLKAAVFWTEQLATSDLGVLKL
ncbi:hypothetical protein AMECASPLE_038752 [Ameca splendens]|uniref:Uncharacterized protein n=1 Tax=Ameca splendens TaxID=208324 RepID=A0ABV0XLB7_9TELE